MVDDERGAGSRHPWRILFTVAVLALVLLAAVLWTQRRSLAERILLDTLRNRGFADPELSVAELDAGRVVIRDLQVGGEEGLRIDSVEAHYTPSGLQEGRLASLRVTGARAHGVLDADGFSMPALDPVLAGEAGPDADIAPGGPLLPVDEVVFRDVRVSLATTDGIAELVLALEARWDGNAVEAHAELDLRYPPLDALDGAVRFELDGRVEPAESGLVFRGSVNEVRRKLSFDAALNLDVARGEGKVVLTMNPLRFEPKGRQPGDVLSLMRAHIQAAGGVLNATATLAWDASGTRETLDIELSDFRIASEFGSVRQLNAPIRLAGPWPPTTPDEQVLSMARLNFGLELTHGLLRYRIRPGWVIELSGAEWRFAGGTVHTAGRVDLGAEEQQLVLELADVDLTQLFALVELEGLSGSGTLGGRLPVTRRSDGLEIRGGRLEATGERGWIRYRPDAQVAALASAEENMKTLFAALENYHYESLEVTLDGDPNDTVVVGLHLRGANPDYEAGRQVNLNVNLEVTLSSLLRSVNAFDWLPGLIEERLKQKP